MSYEIYLPQTFQRCIKHLKKKFHHIKDDLSAIFQSLEESPQIGDPIPGWNRKVWKIRVSSRDLKRGKAEPSGSSTHGLPVNESFTPYSFILRERKRMLRKLKLKLSLENCFWSWSNPGERGLPHAIFSRFHF